MIEIAACSPKGTQGQRGMSKSEKTAHDPVANQSPASVEPPVHDKTDAEIAIIKRIAGRMDEASPAPRYKLGTSDTGTPILKADHSDPPMTTVLLCDVFATASTTLATGLRDQLHQAARAGPDLKAEALNVMLTVVRAIGPRDELEALLATQMAAIHNGAMVAARRLNHVENIPQQDSASNMLNKLARTFTMQIEALKRYRSAGEQTIKVQHVTVNEGGQAIVGDVTQQRGGASNETDHQPVAPQAAGHDQAASGLPLLGHVETVPFAMPVAGGPRLDCVPDARRTRRRA